MGTAICYHLATMSQPRRGQEGSVDLSDRGGPALDRTSAEFLSQTAINLAHYGEPAAGRSDYWRLMAAPRFRAATIVELVVDARPLRVLDIGCGGGTLLASLQEQLPEAHLTGLDLSAAQIELNRVAYPNITWYEGTAEELHQVLPDRYNAIVASELIEHLGDAAGFLRNVRRVAAPRGQLVISTQSGRVGETERRVGHLRHFTVGEMSALLSSAGWYPERVWNAGFPFQDLSKYIANLAPDYSMRRFGARAYGPFERLASLVLRGLFRLNSQSRGAQLFAVGRNVAGECD